MNSLKIPQSNFKVILYILVNVAFLYFGLYAFYYLGPELYIKLFGLALMVTFGLIGLFMLKKLLANEIGLELNQQGIIDNSSAFGVGLIEWKDIEEITTNEFKSSKSLLIKVKTPELYIQKFSARWKKWGLRMGYQWHATPIAIHATWLKCSFSQLEEWILEGWQSSKKKSMKEN